MQHNPTHNIAPKPTHLPPHSYQHHIKTIHSLFDPPLEFNSNDHTNLPSHSQKLLPNAHRQETSDRTSETRTIEVTGPDVFPGCAEGGC